MAALEADHWIGYHPGMLRFILALLCCLVALAAPAGADCETTLRKLENPLVVAPSTRVAAAFLPRIQGLERRLDELKLRFPDKHPDVVATMRTLEALQAQHEEERAALAAGTQEPTPRKLVEQGRAAYKSGDYETALCVFRLAAEQGDAEGQYILGGLYEMGRGVPQDYAESVKWFRKAAEQGYLKAQINLGSMYYHGLGGPQDYTEAAKWFRKAAEQGDVAGLGILGIMYALGHGVPQDLVKAHMWLNLAGAQDELVDDIAAARDLLAKLMTSDEVLKAQRMAKDWLAKHGKAD